MRPVSGSQLGPVSISRPRQTGALKYMGDLAADGSLPPGFADQAETTMNNVEALLASAGTTKAHLGSGSRKVATSAALLFAGQTLP
ncbi:MAG: RidA family protein [Hyphomicrobiaceae bacterium]|nr:MAG: RidA family protein [Hyphomicrobiaceae bacterium]